MSARQEAAYEALGFVLALYESGDIPKCVEDVAFDILTKAGEIEAKKVEAVA